MGQVKKGVRDVRFVGDTTDDDNITRLCKHCEEYGFKHKLGPRILMQGQVKTEDWDYYMQCPSCGLLQEKESARVESDISDVVDKENSSSDGYAISLDDPRLSRRIREYKIIQWD